jgi:AcrR family transcriptional regulator
MIAIEDDTATEILEATYRALCQHGYANLTLNDIAGEANRSKSTVYYYYDSKENLFIEFLDFLYERYTARLPSIDGGEPHEQLYALLETVFIDEEAAPSRKMQTALLEAKAQAPYNETIQMRLSNFEKILFERLRDIIAAGVESGEFNRTVEPAVAAEFLVTVITGAHTRGVAVDRSPEEMYKTITRYTENNLLAPELSEGAQ